MELKSDEAVTGDEWSAGSQSHLYGIEIFRGNASGKAFILSQSHLYGIEIAYDWENLISLCVPIAPLWN